MKDDYQGLAPKEFWRLRKDEIVESFDGWWEGTVDDLKEALELYHSFHTVQGLEKTKNKVWDAYMKEIVAECMKRCPLREKEIDARFALYSYFKNDMEREEAEEKTQ